MLVLMKEKKVPGKSDNNQYPNGQCTLFPQFLLGNLRVKNCYIDQYL